jgi:hypothetical protein
MPNYLTVPEELQRIADKLLSHFRGSGFVVKVENQTRLGCPYLATMECKRRQTLLLVDIQPNLPDGSTLREWTSYCRAQSTDVRYLLAMPMQVTTVNSLIPLKDAGIGIVFVDDDTELRIHVEHEARDTRLDGALPTLARFPNPVRKILGPSWDVLARDDFVIGFDDACVAFETAVRNYLVRHVQSGRIRFASVKGKTITYSSSEIRKMPMGALKMRFHKLLVRITPTLLSIIF